MRGNPGLPEPWHGGSFTVWPPMRLPNGLRCGSSLAPVWLRTGPQCRLCAGSGAAAWWPRWRSSAWLRSGLAVEHTLAPLHH